MTLDKDRRLIEDSLERLISVKRNPTYPYLHKLIQTTTEMAILLCEHALGKGLSQERVIRASLKVLDRIKSQPATKVKKIVSGYAGIGLGLAAAGFKESAMLAAQLIEDGRRTIESPSEEYKALYPYWIGSITKNVGELERAFAAFAEAGDIARECGNSILQGNSQFHLGEIRLMQGEKAEAKTFFESCRAANPKHSKAGEYLRELSGEVSDA